MSALVRLTSMLVIACQKEIGNFQNVHTESVFVPVLPSTFQRHVHGLEEKAIKRKRIRLKLLLNSYRKEWHKLLV